jgi:hypothetical protein
MRYLVSSLPGINDPGEEATGACDVITRLMTAGDITGDQDAGLAPDSLKVRTPLTPLPPVRAPCPCPFLLLDLSQRPHPAVPSSLCTPPQCLVTSRKFQEAICQHWGLLSWKRGVLQGTHK